ncbi:DUF1269 domain-containing protein [Variovorax sp. H27-G14]|uniref:DUF1269 domain-containing protein n=1 Tax=Variovorax sp. H27-G14 TaxID=3111914 RepID=UPI0038FC1787
MNKLLVVVFGTEADAEAGTRVLRNLDSEGDITLYALGVISKDAKGLVSVKKAVDSFGVGAGMGLAVGALIGLLAGPVGVVAGAAAGTLLGTVRDYWVAGVGPGFIEEASTFLKPGTTAVVAEVEEDWVTPVDAAMDDLGGSVIRRARMAMLQDQFDQDIVAMKAEISGLEAECQHSSGAAQTRLRAALSSTQTNLAQTTARATKKLAEFRQETELRVHAIEAQIAKAQGKVRARLETRLERVHTAYAERSAKLSRAWGLTREALSA